jgi:putative flippase GtrA
VSALAQLARHQVGSIVATVIDFLTMIAWVELAHGSPVTGTALGASCGATTNFVMGRRWIFKVEGPSAFRQALRYALVAAGSLALNSLGQELLLKHLGMTSYVFTRAGVAVTVAMSWNYPLHRFFVFRGGRGEAA